MVSLSLITGTMAKWTMTVGVVEKKLRAGIFSVAIKTGESGGEPIWKDIIQGGLGGSVTIPLTETVYQHDDASAATATYYDTKTEHPFTLDGAGTAGLGHGTLVKKEKLTAGVFAPDAKTVIAPGCWGEFMLTMKNFSEVDVAVKLTQASNWVTGLAGVPLEWRCKKTDGTWPAGWESDLTTALTTASLPAVTVLKSGPASSGGNDQWSQEIQWRWRFERGGSPAPGASGWPTSADVYDTDLGAQAVAAEKSLNVPITISITQID